MIRRWVANPSPRVRRRAGAAGVGLVLGALAAHRISAMAATGALVGDEARTAVSALLAGAQRPLLGVPTTSSEFIDRNLLNPGPILQYAMYPFVRTLGTDLGAWTFAATVALASLAVAGWVATRRLGGVAGLVTLLLGLAMASATNPGGFGHSLNTEVVLLPTFATAVLAWGVAAGDHRLLPVLAITSTFVTQTFVGAAPLVVLPVLVAIVGATVHQRRAPEAHFGRSVALAGVAAAVLWSPPLIDQISGTGNLTGLLGFRTPGRGAAGAWASLRSSLNLGGDLTGINALDPHGFDVRIPLAYVGIAVLPRARAAARTLLPLFGTTVAVVAGSMFVSAADPPTDTATYHFFNVGLARHALLLPPLLVLVTAAVSRWDARTWARSPRAQKFAAVTVVALAAGLLLRSATEMIDRDGTDRRRRNEMSAVRHLAADLRSDLGPGDRIEIASRGGSGAGNVTQGLIARLRGDGVAVVDAYRSPPGDGTRSFVLVMGTPTSAIGRTVADWHPTEPAPTDLPPLDLSALHAQTASRRPLRLNPSGIDNLVDRVDGSAPSLCLDSLLAQPDRLLDLPPEVLAALYGSGELTQPTLPTEERVQVYDWDADRGYTILELPAGGRWEEHFHQDELYLSTSSCP